MAFCSLAHCSSQLPPAAASCTSMSSSLSRTVVQCCLQLQQAALSWLPFLWPIAVHDCLQGHKAALACLSAFLSLQLSAASSGSKVHCHFFSVVDSSTPLPPVMASFTCTSSSISCTVAHQCLQWQQASLSRLPVLYGPLHLTTPSTGSKQQCHDFQCHFR